MLMVGTCEFQFDDTLGGQRYPFKGLSAGHETLVFHEFKNNSDSLFKVSGCKLTITMDMKRDQPLLVELSDGEERIDSEALIKKSVSLIEDNLVREKRSAAIPSAGEDNASDKALIKPRYNLAGLNSDVKMSLADDSKNIMCCDYDRYVIDIDASQRASENSIQFNVYTKQPSVAFLTTRIYSGGKSEKN
ncbi:unnamed protein product [Gordionus sp. m RMFG-2023]